MRGGCVLYIVPNSLNTRDIIDIIENDPFSGAHFTKVTFDSRLKRRLEVKNKTHQVLQHQKTNLNDRKLTR